jgi:hypothetical protein
LREKSANEGSGENERQVGDESHPGQPINSGRLLARSASKEIPFVKQVICQPAGHLPDARFE